MVYNPGSTTHVRTIVRDPRRDVLRRLPRSPPNCTLAAFPVYVAGARSTAIARPLTAIGASCSRRLDRAGWKGAGGVPPTKSWKNTLHGPIASRQRPPAIAALRELGTANPGGSWRRDSAPLSDRLPAV